MPSILGAILSAVVPKYIQHKDGTGHRASPTHQIWGMMVTMVVSISTGLLTGFVMKMVAGKGDAFDDAMFWDVAPEDYGQQEDPEQQPLAVSAPPPQRPVGAGCLNCTR